MAAHHGSATTNKRSNRRQVSKFTVITAAFVCLCIIRLWKTDVAELENSTTKKIAMDRGQTSDVAGVTGGNSNTSIPPDNDFAPESPLAYPTKQSPTSKAVPFHSKNSFHSKGFQTRYANSPFVQGYKPTGGDLPQENGDWLFSESSWKYLSNHCLLNETAIPDWQRRAPYAILLGAMKVRR